MECYLTVTCASCQLLALKQYLHPFLQKRVFNCQKLVCEEFLIHITYQNRQQISKLFITNPFPKIDKI